MAMIEWRILRESQIEDLASTKLQIVIEFAELLELLLILKWNLVDFKLQNIENLHS